ncbi:MAG: DoxX family protein [Bacteroidales bacterium]|nr:DoxX family protein [Bacteroidales bacterium]
MNSKKIFFSAWRPSWANEIVINILRIATGMVMLSSHGWPKYMNYTVLFIAFPDPLGIGSTLSLMLTIFAEVFCSLLLIFGLFTRLAIIPLIITMIVAISLIHSGDAFQQKELAFVYLFIYVMLLFTGPGKFSLDRYFSNKNKSLQDTEHPNNGIWK